MAIFDFFEKNIIESNFKKKKIYRKHKNWIDTRMYFVSLRRESHPKKKKKHRVLLSSLSQDIWQWGSLYMQPEFSSFKLCLCFLEFFHRGISIVPLNITYFFLTDWQEFFFDFCLTQIECMFYKQMIRITESPVLSLRLKTENLYGIQFYLLTM